MARFLRYLLNYTFLSALLIGAVIAYIYRDELAPLLDKGFETSEPVTTGLKSEVVKLTDDTVGETEKVESKPTFPSVSQSEISGDPKQEVDTSLPVEMLIGEQITPDGPAPDLSLLTIDPKSSKPLIEIGKKRSNEAEDKVLSDLNQKASVKSSTEVEIQEVKRLLVANENLPQDESSVATTVDSSPAEKGSESVSSGTISTDKSDTEAEQNLLESESEPKSTSEEILSHLIKARDAYWKGDFDLAESLYIELAEQDVNSPDAPGELGNLYFSQGMYDEAAAVYGEATERLIKAGYNGRAAHMIKVLYGISPESARRLEEKNSGQDK